MTQQPHNQHKIFIKSQTHPSLCVAYVAFALSITTDFQIWNERDVSQKFTNPIKLIIKMHRRAPSTITNNTVFFEKENIIQEMIDTEHNYVKSLRAIIDDYQKPLEKSKCISERHLKAIFNNISIIYNINSTILKSLDEFHGNLKTLIP